ncbi:MAG: hypothetical protein V1867_02760 [Candidatus Falkowbacteria bacterium]
MADQQIKRYEIKNLDDLNNALSQGLKNGDRIILNDVQSAVFVSYQKGAINGHDAIVTVELDRQYLTARGLYIINKDGLFYQAHSFGEPEDASKLAAVGLLPTAS